MNIPFADHLLYRYVKERSFKGDKVAPSDSLRLSAVKRVLLIVTTGLGDAVLSTPVIPAIRSALPDADIRLFLRSGWVELFRNDPNINGIIPYHGKYRRFYSTVRALRSFSPQLTLVLHGNDPDIIPLAYLSGSRFIVRIPWKQTRYDFLLSNTGRQQDAESLPDMHYIENRLRILDTVNIHATEHATYLVLPEKALSDAAEKARAAFGSPARYWIFHFFAADGYKMWSEAKARGLIDAALRALPHHRIILTGGPRDRKTAARLAKGFPRDRVCDMSGGMSLVETAACIAGADFLVGPDTGILHIAAALDVPTVALYAPTSSELVGPRSRSARHRVIQKPPTCSPCPTKRCPQIPSTCMDQITIDEVLEEMRRAL